MASNTTNNSNAANAQGGAEIPFEVYAKFLWGREQSPPPMACVVYQWYHIGGPLPDTLRDGPGAPIQNQQFARKAGDNGPQGRVTLVYADARLVQVFFAGFPASVLRSVAERLNLPDADNYFKRAVSVAESQPHSSSEYEPSPSQNSSSD